MGLGGLAGCQAAQRWLCLAECLHGLGGKGRASADLSHVLKWESWLEPRAIYGPRDAGSEVIASLIVRLKCFPLEVTGLVGI